MKKFLASTAVALAFAVPAYAESHSSATFLPMVEFEARYASELMGARLYISEDGVEEGAMEISDEWDDVGEIRDIVIDPNGDVVAVTADIGGFLGLGEKTVAVRMDDLRFISDGDSGDEYFVVLKSTEEALDAAPEFEWNQTKGTETASATVDMNAETEDEDGDAMAAAEVKAEDETKDNMATAAMLPSNNRDYRFEAPEVSVEGYSTADRNELTTEQLTGAPLYDANNEWIGEVHAVIIDDAGKLGDAILDVGGFLGIGEKQVAVNFEELTLKTDADGSDLRVYIDASKQQLEDLPDHDM